MQGESERKVRPEREKYFLKTDGGTEGGKEGEREREREREIGRKKEMITLCKHLNR